MNPAARSGSSVAVQGQYWEFQEDDCGHETPPANIRIIAKKSDVPAKVPANTSRSTATDACRATIYPSGKVVRTPEFRKVHASLASAA
jgi:hypothetical protein